MRAMLKNFLMTIEDLSGSEYIDRALCYANTLQPEDARDDKNTLELIFQLRRELRYV